MTQCLDPQGDIVQPELNPGRQSLILDLANMGLFLYTSPTIYLHLTQGKKLSEHPGSGGCSLRQRLSGGSFVSLAKPPKLVGAGGDGRQEPRQDEGPQSLGG